LARLLSNLHFRPSNFPPLPTPPKIRKPQPQSRPRPPGKPAHRPNSPSTRPLHMEGGSLPALIRAAHALLRSAPPRYFPKNTRFPDLLLHEIPLKPPCPRPISQISHPRSASLQPAPKPASIFALRPKYAHKSLCGSPRRALANIQIQ
jgi:hypothetical protein